MYVAELSFKQFPVDPEKAELGIRRLLRTWRNSGQVAGAEWPLSLKMGRYRLWVMIPERNSLSRQHNNKFANEALAAMRENDLSMPKITIVGRDPNSLDEDRCRKRKSFVLYTSYVSLESPLKCGDCLNPIPLYRLPYTDDVGHHDHIHFWSLTYQRCDGLFMGSTTGEKFGYREISNFASSLTRSGLEVCKRIKKVTGLPCYYFLNRYYGRTQKEERKRRCPGCGGKWLLAERWHGRFDFRCDKCKLVSELAPDYWG